VFITQNGLPFLFPGHLTEATVALAKLYKRAAPFLCTQPCYFGGPFALNWGSDDVDLLNLSVKKLAKRQHKRGVATRYWTPAVHAAAFALPGYVQEVVDKVLAAPAEKGHRRKSKIRAQS
jgi:spermidine synthase